MTLTAAEVWRDYVTSGVPASGAKQPEKRDIRAWGAFVETISGGGGPGLGYATKALLNADLAHSANSLAVVYSDSTPGNNGLYVKTGASGSGSWTRVGDLPNGVVRLTPTGGTANAIIATAPETPSVPGAKLYLLTPTAQNTGATTIAVNGGAAVPIKNAFGVALASGSLLADSQVLMAWQVDHYQLLISANVDADAILAAAQAAAVAAEGSATDAAASALSLTYASQEEAEAGTAADRAMSPLRTVQLIKKREGFFNIEDYGAIGDGLDSSASGNVTAFADAVAALGSLGGSIFVPYGTFVVDENILNAVDKRSIRIYGPGSPNASPDYETATIIFNAASGSLIKSQGTVGLEIDHINLAYSNPSYGGRLVDLSQGTGGVLTCFVHIHHFRMGGLYGVAAGADSLVFMSDTLKVSIEHGFMAQAVSAVCGALSGAANVNCVNLHDIWFERTSHAPVLVGGQSWNIDYCIFEPQSDGESGGINTVYPTCYNLNITRNRFDDGGTTGNWVDLTNVKGGTVTGNFFRNGARAINCNNAKSVIIEGNTFFARESVPPIVLGTSGITPGVNFVTTDSGSNVPALT